MYDPSARIMTNRAAPFWMISFPLLRPHNIPNLWMRRHLSHSPPTTMPEATINIILKACSPFFCCCCICIHLLFSLDGCGKSYNFKSPTKYYFNSSCNHSFGNCCSSFSNPKQIKFILLLFAASVEIVQSVKVIWKI